MSRFASFAYLLAACGDSAAVVSDASPDTPPDACVAPSVTPVDCAGTACAAIEIAGDPIPAVGFRGYADPSVRADPGGGRIWLGYSFVRPTPAIEVETHLAHSDDAGGTWTFDRVLWPNTPAPMNAGVMGYFNSEVVSLAPVSSTTWFASRMAYLHETSPEDKILISTFMVRISHATVPDQLYAAQEQVIGLTSFLPAGYGAATDLNALSGLACTYWNDPGLFYRSGTLYLTAECVGQGTIHLFGATATDDVTQLVWTDRGALTTPADASELGDDELDQADLEEADDGTLLLTVTPSHAGTPLATHEGCRTLSLDQLDPPILHRDCGALVPRASVTATDLASTGSCGYDRHAIGVGLVLARRPEAGQPGTLVKSGAP